MSTTQSSKASCHSSGNDAAALETSGNIALVGHPNVGKSVLFKRLTGRFVMISNYPGTTVELTRGTARGLADTGVIDTPGVVSLPARSEDEEVTMRVLLNEPVRTVVQVGDCKNLRRTLLLTLQLATMQLQPLVMRQAVHQARFLGVRRHHVVQTVFAGLRQSIDPMVMEAAAEAVGDLLAGWEE